MTQEDVHFVDKSAESEVGSPADSAVSVPTLSKPGLLVMDVDSTLIDEEVIDELGVVAGCGEEIAGVTARAMRGELEFCDALRARVALLEGLPISVFDTVHDKLHFTKGALELIDTLHEHGWKIGVVSGGFHEVVDMLAAEGHIDYWIANRLEVADGCLTGKVLGEIVSKTVKFGYSDEPDRGCGRWRQRYSDDSGRRSGSRVLCQAKDPARRRQSHQRPRPNPRTRLPAPVKFYRPRLRHL